ncbi:MAG: class I SAM-dependent methyltransferase [Microcoleaceae cyanobacterium]
MPNPTKPQDENKFSPSDWSTYYKICMGRPPRHTLLRALECFNVNSSSTESRFAVDLGFGTGRDTIELLERGWQVLAIDSQKEAIDCLLSYPKLALEGLETRICCFEELILPKSIDLVNASFSLPFCSPEYFGDFWEKIVFSLRCGGRFCGQFFDDRDSWATRTSMSHHTREQVEELLQAFEIEFFEEEDYLGKTALDEQKNWHIFHIVACKLR